MHKHQHAAYFVLDKWLIWTLGGDPWMCTMQSLRSLNSTSQCLIVSSVSFNVSFVTLQNPTVDFPSTDERGLKLDFTAGVGATTPSTLASFFREENENFFFGANSSSLVDSKVRSWDNCWTNTLYITRKNGYNIIVNILDQRTHFLCPFQTILRQIQSSISDFLLQCLARPLKCV